MYGLQSGYPIESDMIQNRLNLNGLNGLSTFGRFEFKAFGARMGRGDLWWSAGTQLFGRRLNLFGRLHDGFIIVRVGSGRALVVLFLAVTKSLPFTFPAGFCRASR